MHDSNAAHRFAAVYVIGIHGRITAWHDATVLPVGLDSAVEFAAEERPDFRAQAAALAAALASWYAAIEPQTLEPGAITFWRIDCAKSPLPEVRRSFPATNPPK